MMRSHPIGANRKLRGATLLSALLLAGAACRAGQGCEPPDGTEKGGTHRTPTAWERGLPCVIDGKVGWGPSMSSAIVGVDGLSFQVQGNARASLGEHNGIGFYRLPGRGDDLQLFTWNLEHIFDGVQHEDNKDPSRARIFEPRQQGTVMDAFKLTDSDAVLYQPATPFWGLESATLFSAKSNNTIDLTFSARLTRSTPKTDWFGLFWATYPSQHGVPLYFPGRSGSGEPLVWIEGRSLHHLVRNTFIHDSAPATVEFVKGYPDKLYTSTAEARERVVHPVFYGALPEGPMFAMMLDGGPEVRITHSPLPAWDAQWIVHGYQVGACYTLRARILIGADLTPDSIIENYEGWSGVDVPTLPAQPVRSNPYP